MLICLPAASETSGGCTDGLSQPLSPHKGLWSQGSWEWPSPTYQHRSWVDCQGLACRIVKTHPRRMFQHQDNQSIFQGKWEPRATILKRAPLAASVAGACRWPALHLGHAAPSRSQKTHHHGRLLTCNSPCRGHLAWTFRGFGIEGREQCWKRTKVSGEQASEPRRKTA